MEDAPTHTQTDSDRYAQLRRRAKRGLVASYIREITPRRNGRPERKIERVGELIESTQGA
jgi:hypothetical protein